jgi:hypothetical protein
MARFLLVLLFNLPPLFHGKSGSMSAAAPIPELLSSGVGEAPGGPSVSPPFEHYKQKDASKGQSSVLGQHSLAKGQLLSPHSIESSLLHLTPFPALLVFLSYQVSSLIFPSSVVVRFKSIGSAPIMKNNVFKVTAGNRFQAVIVFLRTQLGLNHADPLVRLSKPDWDGS